MIKLHWPGTVILNSLNEGTYTNCKLRVTDASGNTSDWLSIPTFVINEDVSNPPRSNIEEFKFQLINSAYEVLEKDIVISSDTQLIRIPLKDFSVKEFVLLPRPYPHFLPYYFKANTGKLNDSDKELNFIQIHIPVKNKMESNDRLRLQFSAIRLVK